MNDLISRQAAIDAIEKAFDRETILNRFVRKIAISSVRLLPPAEQQPSIPLSWIEKHLEWLDNCDNDFAELAKVSIRAMIRIWEDDHE